MHESGDESRVQEVRMCKYNIPLEQFLYTSIDKMWQCIYIETNH